jgi:shikimate kinase
MATVVLTGFMGTGKTSIGERLAARLGRPFIDTDTLVEQRDGRPVAAIFAEAGEAYFRAAERQAIAEAVTVPGAVIATGGGAVVDPANVARLRAAAPIVCLTARPAVILARAGDGRTRPLMQGDDPARRIAALLAARASAYAAADLELDTSDAAIDDIVAAIERFLRERTRAEERP